jgi:hypothetical protein
VCVCVCVCVCVFVCVYRVEFNHYAIRILLSPKMRITRLSFAHVTSCAHKRSPDVLTSTRHHLSCVLLTISHVYSSPSLMCTRHHLSCVLVTISHVYSSPSLMCTRNHLSCVLVTISHVHSSPSLMCTRHHLSCVFVAQVSPPVTDDMIHSNEIVFDLQGFNCGGDLRITVFQEHKMMDGIREGLCLADVSSTPHFAPPPPHPPTHTPSSSFSLHPSLYTH